MRIRENLRKVEYKGNSNYDEGYVYEEKRKKSCVLTLWAERNSKQISSERQCGKSQWIKTKAGRGNARRGEVRGINDEIHGRHDWVNFNERPIHTVEVGRRCVNDSELTPRRLWWNENTNSRASTRVSRVVRPTYTEVTAREDDADITLQAGWTVCRISLYKPGRVRRTGCRILLSLVGSSRIAHVAISTATKVPSVPSELYGIEPRTLGPPTRVII